MKRAIFPADSDWTWILSKSFIVLVLQSVFTTLVSMAANTNLTLYAQTLGANMSVAGTLVGITSVASIIMFPFTGPASTHLDRRNLVIFSASLLLLGNLGFVFFTSIPVLMVCRFIIGASQGFASIATMVIVAELLPPDKLTIGIGYYGLAGIVFQSIGPAMMLAFAARFGYIPLFILLSVLCAANLGLCFLLPESRPITEKPFSLKTIQLKEIVAPEAIVPALIGFFFAFNNSIQMSFVAAYAEDSGIGGAGVYFTVEAVFMVIARLFMGKITNARKVSFAAIFSGAFLLAFDLFLGFGHGIITLWIGGALFGFGYGTLLPVTQSICMKVVPEERRGSGSNTYFICISLAFSVAGTVGGYLIDHIGYTALFLMLSVPTVISIALAGWKANYPVSPEAYTGFDREKFLPKTNKASD